MSLITRLLATRSRAVLGGAALLAGMVAAPGAWAQCADNFNIVGFPPIFGSVPVSQLFPLGGGSTVSSLASTINTINTAFLTQTTAFVSAPGNPQPDQQGGGVWGRVIGGTVDTKSSSVGNLDLVGLTVTGTQRCETSTRQDYWGYQVGHDISILNGGGTGANWHFGVTAGSLSANTRDTTAAGSFANTNLGPGTFSTPAGSLETDTEVPFAGIYTAFTKGGFFLDGQVRWDFFQNTLTDRNNGLSGQGLNAQGVSLTGNIGYNHGLGRGWFIEPSGGVVFSRVSIDPLNVPGVAVNIPGVGVGSVGRGRVAVEDIESVLGRLSLRVGTNFTSGRLAWQPFFTASVFHEFAGDVTVRAEAAGDAIFLIPGDVLTIRSEGGVGTYGQFALGTAAALLNTGWLGYARVDYRIGEDIDGWSVNAGLRYQFTPEQRGGVKDGAVPAIQAYNWTGPYIGAFVGRTEGDEHQRFVAFGTLSEPDFGGYLVGGQVGYNVHSGNTVVGVEVDYGHTNANGAVSCPNAFLFTCEASADNLGSVTGRLGYSWGRALFYAKGGWAFGEVATGGRFNNPPIQVGDDSKWRNGWTLGGGMEFALTDRWSAKAEYMHYDLGSEVFTIQRITPGGAPIGAAGLADIDTRGDSVRIGVNLHLHPVQREAAPIK